MNKTFISLGLALILFAGVFFILNHNRTGGNLAGTGINNPQFTSASSTAFTVTTSTSLRLLATSSRRVAATIQTHNCATGGVLFLRADSDVAATANTGLSVNASTTQSFSSFPDTPVPTGSVQGITVTGTCTVLVTEWRSTY